MIKHLHSLYHRVFGRKRLERCVVSGKRSIHVPDCAHTINVDNLVGFEDVSPSDILVFPNGETSDAFFLTAKGEAALAKPRKSSAKETKAPTKRKSTKKATDAKKKTTRKKS